MATFGPVTKYVAPEVANPFAEPVAEIVKQGVDTLFTVRFDADSYTAEKLQIQNAARALGFSARVHETDADKDGKPTKGKTITTVFRIRPPRKGKGEAAEDNSADDSADTDAENAPEEVTDAG